MTVPEESKVSNLLYVGLECPEFRILPDSELKLDDTLWHHLSLVRNWYSSSMSPAHEWNHFIVCCMYVKSVEKYMFIKIFAKSPALKSLDMLMDLLHAHEWYEGMGKYMSTCKDAMQALQVLVNADPNIPSFSELEVYGAVVGADV